MLQKVIEYLNKRGWSYSRADDDGSIFISLTHDNGTYHCIIYAKDDANIFAFVSFLGTRCPPDKMESILRLINSANNALLYGNFEINQNGDIKHRTSFYLEHTVITDDIIEGVMMRNIYNLDFANPIFSRMMFGDMKNDEAMNLLFPHLKDETKELSDVITAIENTSNDK